MKKSIIICFLATLLYAVTQSKIYSQNVHTIQNLSDSVQTAWVNNYTMEDFSLTAFAVVVDSSGNVYVTGCSFSYTTRTDYATVKYDSNGTEIWSVLYNGPNYSTDRARDLAVDDSGNV